MKKVIVTLTLLITMMTSSFANDEKVRSEVVKSFTSKFNSAREVTWTTGSTYYRAAFIYNGNWMYAYYNKSAELLGLRRNIVSTQLPFYLQDNLKKNFAAYWITDLFELSDEDGYRYYVTLQNADKTRILVSEDGSGWIEK